MKLTCEQFASVLSVDCGIEKEMVYAILNAASRRITNLLIDGNSIGWKNLGVLKPIVRATKRVRVPSTGKIMEVPEHISITFLPAKELKAKVRR